ncbi:MAG: aspartate/glutamate racemase family protein [Sporomusaceae bacterium]|nr:aspartate/glutamate racemase family protein [Sporomusaceae bacterium]
MKTIGLIGGMSWESTVTYYQIINQTVKNRLGGLHSAKCLLYSVDFAEIERNMTAGDWQKNAEILAAAAVNLEKAGADFIVICTNTMHKLAEQIQAAVSIPLVHIAEATADELKRNKLTKAALLGTKYTMTQDFYKEKLIACGIDVLIPEQEDIETINSIIFNELCLGRISAEAKTSYLAIIEKLTRMGAQGIILGCTEIGLLLNQNDTPAPLFDTTVIHATKAALLATGSDS